MYLATRVKTPSNGRPPPYLWSFCGHLEYKLLIGRTAVEPAITYHQYRRSLCAGRTLECPSLTYIGTRNEATVYFRPNGTLRLNTGNYLGYIQPLNQKLDTRISFVLRLSSSVTLRVPPWILKRAGLKSSGLIASS